LVGRIGSRMSVPVSSKLKSLLVPSTRVVVFTGAGVSAESGVPVFRGQNGMWNEFRVEELATPQAFVADPRRVWEWYDWRRQAVSRIEPNAGHLAVVEFERFFDSCVVVTQNVDGLHNRAGSRQVLKLHGDLWEVRCLSCGLSRMDLTSVFPSLPPSCDCGGMLRPGVVWFGESLPLLVFEKAVEVTEQCALFFSIGTSAEVYPAAHLPGIARRHGAYVVEVNVERSAAAEMANEILLGKSGEILPQLVTHFQVEQASPVKEMRNLGI
jgi:NAD-dependent deacetylase